MQIHKSDPIAAVIIPPPVRLDRCFRQLASAFQSRGVFPQQFPELFSSLRKTRAGSFSTAPHRRARANFNRTRGSSPRHCRIDIRSREKNQLQERCVDISRDDALTAQRQRPVIMRARDAGKSHGHFLCNVNRHQ